jgi:hypothetical protein
MPGHTREQRREARDRQNREWAQWLTTAMANPPIDVKTLVQRAALEGDSIDKTIVSRWLNGETTPDPNRTVTVARALNRDPAAALRAAGHNIVATAMAQRDSEPPVGAAQTWRAWLLETIGAEEAILDLTARSKGAITTATARAWAAGAESATPIAAILTARLLGADESSALTAAGHSHYAAVFAALNPHAPALNGEQ